MNGVKVPEPGNPMEGPMDPILHEIGKEHNGHELHNERETTVPGPQLTQGCQGQKRFRRSKGQEGQHLHHQAADEIVKKIFAPLLAKYRWLGVLWEKAL